MAALRASLEIFHQASMKALRQKSIMLTGYLEFLLNQLIGEKLEIITPNNPDERGCQLSLRVRSKNRRILEDLIANGVTVDWREPDVIRVAPVPLYNTFSEIFEFSQILKRVVLSNG
jgi:kynureninase